MNYYKVRMNYIPDYNDEKGICMNLLLVEDALNLGKILKRQMRQHVRQQQMYILKQNKRQSKSVSSYCN